MMIEGIKLSYDDVCVVPEDITDVSSRKECDPYDENGYLPIFASCMNTVVDFESGNEFIKNGINVVYPRTESLPTRVNHVLNNGNVFVAFSLEEVKMLFLSDEFKFPFSHRIKICIDLANGHMRQLLETIKQVKNKYGDDVIIMSGNIAKAKTYKYYEEAGCDYVRAGIGGGSACSTTSTTGIGFPYFSLIKEMYEIKKAMNGKCKIIADGNIRSYRDIQKALIYADYVMIGGLFNKALESAGVATYGKSYFNIRGFKVFRPFKTLLTYGREINRKDYKSVSEGIKNGTVTVWKKFYGMSTELAQEEIAKAKGVKPINLKTSEGLVKYQRVEYSLCDWAKEESDHLRSAMSYTNSRNLEEYKDSDWVVINQIRYNN